MHSDHNILPAPHVKNIIFKSLECFNKLNVQRCAKPTEHTGLFSVAQEFPSWSQCGLRLSESKQTVHRADERCVENLLAFHIMKENPWGLDTKKTMDGRESCCLQVVDEH